MDRQMLEQYIKRQVRKTKKKQKNNEDEGGSRAIIDKKQEYLALPDREKRKFVRAEEKEPKMKIAVRFFQLRKPITQQHSFIVGVEMGGLSEDISTIIEIRRSASFQQFRVALEEKKDRGMVRRTITFQALRHFMEICSNPHGYNDKRRLVKPTMYCFSKFNHDWKASITFLKFVLTGEPNIGSVSWMQRILKSHRFYRLRKRLVKISNYAEVLMNTKSMHWSSLHIVFPIGEKI